MNKFKVGDTVKVNTVSDRLPKWIVKRVAVSNKRTITGTFYDNKSQHTRYYLGSNGRGADLGRYPFRAEELRLYTGLKLHTKRLKLMTQQDGQGVNVSITIPPAGGMPLDLDLAGALKDSRINAGGS